jgi:raffinose/stachyose/melibiose transport system permease protein
MRARYSRWSAFREAGLWLAAIPILLPIYFVVVTALKPADEGSGHYFKPPAHPTFENISDAWSQAGGGTLSFAEALFNSVLTTAVVVALLIVLAAPAAYVISRRGSRLAGALFGMFALGLILPVQLGIIPLYALMVEAELAGTREGLILVYLGMLLPLSIFLYTGFFRSLPPDYEEAARVDGASSARIFLQVVFPLVRPITGVVAILCGLLVWNDFFVSLVFVGGTDKETLPVAVYSFVGRFSAQWPLIFASALIAMLPVLVFYVFMQRSVMRGFTSTLRG